MRPTQGEEEVSMTEAARRFALTLESVGQFANQAPADCVRTKGRRRLLIWPHFAVWYRQHLQRERKAPSSFDELRKRQAEIDVEIGELELGGKRGDLVPITEFEEQLSQTVTQLRTTMLNLPNRFASRTVGLETLRQSQIVWDGAMREALKVLIDEHDKEMAE
jgi:hypothetical protein